MIKGDIVDLVYERLGLTRAESARIVEAIFDAIKNSLRNGEKVQITGFGTFITREKNERIGRNVKTGEEVKIRSRRSPAFKVSRVFRDFVDKGTGQ